MDSLRINGQAFRKDFTKIQRVMSIPNLIDIQTQSYKDFLQADVPHEKRKSTGLQAVFQSVFPIRDFNNTCELEFVSYSLGEPKYTVEECHQRGMHFAAPLKVVVRLVVYDVSEDRKSRSVRDIKEQEIYFGEIPLMTENGTFIINGTERVIVSQLHRSPGVFFDHDKGKTQARGKLLFSARIIPYRGSWVDFEFDAKDSLFVRIDRRRKMPATILLKALGFSSEEQLSIFFRKEVVLPAKSGAFSIKFDPEVLRGQRAEADIVHPKSGDVILPRQRKFTLAKLRELGEAGIEKVPTTPEALEGKIAATDVVNTQTGEVLVHCNEEISQDTWSKLAEQGIAEVPVIYFDPLNETLAIRNTLLLDKVETSEEAILDIYRRIRPGDPPTKEMAFTLFQNLFFNEERYDLSKVGRLKLNYKLNFNEEEAPLDLRVLRKEDILAVVKHLIGLRNGFGQVDDIDHLGNRRVRSVGELLENQYRLGLVRMERAIKERLSLQDMDTLMPHDLINAKPVSAVIKEFFGSSQLSQFMDQTNPLSEVTHKRRLSALGPGGLTRERAGFEVRDVHPTHYGRICPIETPEGPNIGLIASLSTYARVNEYGFIETPYREAKDGKVSERIRYLTAMDEEDHAIAQANAPLDEENRFVNPTVLCRRGGESSMVVREEVEYMDVSPKQLVSVAASLIPFLENDDANRALMGSNMQRQAVPLIRTDAPLVGTGMEHAVAKDSGVAAVAAHDGVVDWVDATRLVVRRPEEGEDSDKLIDIYNLVKFKRSNQNTCHNQKPIVQKGQVVKKGDIIADGPATQLGELALGRNVLVAFMPWGGYNFEDSILISEKLVAEDHYTSIHIEEFECVARDTKLGKEEITADIPNVGEDALRDLDESGIIRLGADIAPGDILVGKVTPKGETQLSPEEKLLRAIFGEKASEVRDTSLRVPPGVEGTVIYAQVFSRRGVDKDDRARAIEEREVTRLLKDQNDEIRIICESAYNKIKALLEGNTCAADLVDDQGQTLVARRKKLTEAVLKDVPGRLLPFISVVNGAKLEKQIQEINEKLQEQIELIKVVFEGRIKRFGRGDELPPGVIKLVKVYVATKRKVAVGDKMAGRHGNKGVVSRILPMEDMPYLPDGTPVDIVLNPLGVPSRMNVGQILETHMGWAARGLGEVISSMMANGDSPKQLRKKLREIYDKEIGELIDSLDDEEIRLACLRLSKGIPIASPVFEGASEEVIRQYLEMAGLAVDGQSTLYDGRTGEPFDKRVTVGMMYMMKLHHLVDDKIHARSIGPYSLVIQQPLGGKAQFGGQRLGEMEVWAMEAYGAAYTLQEFLTVKSDDVAGRTRMYEAIVKGENTLEPGLPESFNVLVKELQSLCLDVELIELIDYDEKEAEAAD